MSHRFSHLVWLGAGNAAEPANLLSLAENTSLFEAREAACVSLKKNYSQNNINVIQAVITAGGGPVEFTEYSLTEYSAVQTITGLKTLFPGIKSIKNEQVESVSITEVIKALALEGSNNLLIIDIVDCNLALLVALQKNGQLHSFNNIHIQAGIEPLYTGASTASEITNFLQERGYLLEQTNDNDPDLPWLVFSANPLWQVLLQTQQANGVLKSELAEVKKNLAANKQHAEQIKIEAAKKTESTTQQLEQLTKQLAKSKAEYESLQKDQHQKPHIEEINTAVATVTKAKQDVEQQLAKAQQQLREKESEIEKLNQQIKSVQSAIDDGKFSLDEILANKDLELSTLKQQRDEIHSQLSTLRKQHAEANENIEKQKADALKLQAELIEKTQSFTDKEKEQAQLIIKLQAELELVNKHAVARLEKGNQLEKNNRILLETNALLSKQQQSLKHEMLKAEAQIDIIRELLLKQ